MTKAKASVATILLCTLSGLCTAEIYKSVDEYGKVSYSDTPSEQSERVKLQKINIQPPVTPRPRPSPKPADKKLPAQSKQKARADAPEKSPKTQQKRERALEANTSVAAKAPIKPQLKYGLRIALPKAGTSIPKNNQPLTVVLLTKKFLSDGERFQATVNGKSIGKAIKANNLNLQLPQNLGPSFTLGANIINGKGDIVERASPITLSTETKKRTKIEP